MIEENEMKIPITDKFLWEVYDFLEKNKNITDFVFGSSYKKAEILLGDQNPVILKYRKDKNRKEFSKLIYHLKKSNYIKVKNLENKKAIILTKEGLSKALKASFVMEGKKKRKDGKWIMLMFDIPQKNEKSRSLLKSILYNLGYKLFQQSVWVTPYDVSEKTEKLLQIYSLDKYVKILLVKEI